MGANRARNAGNTTQRRITMVRAIGVGTSKDTVDVSQEEMPPQTHGRHIADLQLAQPVNQVKRIFNRKGFTGGKNIPDILY